MGDDCNVVARRSEADSPSSSSPKVAAAQRIKIIEESQDRDIPLDERESLLLAKQSGDPGEGMHKITDNRDVPENHFAEVRNENFLTIARELISFPTYFISHKSQCIDFS